MSSLYILFATIALNLLIAIVSDVYPRERKASDSLWETIVTQAIQDGLRLDNTFHKVDQEQIKVWDRKKVLLGKDGIKHWNKIDAVTVKAHDNLASTECVEAASHTANLSSRISGLESKVDALLAAIQSSAAFAPQQTFVPQHNAISPRSASNDALSTLNDSQTEEVVNRAEQLVRQLTYSGSCSLKRVKKAANEASLPWETVKLARRNLGVVQVKEIICTDDGSEQATRFWRQGTGLEGESRPWK